MYIVRHCTSVTKPWIFCFFLTQTQHRDQLATLEQAIQTKEEELGELLPNYQRMKTEENECSSRWHLYFLWKLILFSIDTLSQIKKYFHHKYEEKKTTQCSRILRFLVFCSWLHTYMFKEQQTSLTMVYCKAHWILHSVMYGHLTVIM